MSDESSFEEFGEGNLLQGYMYEPKYDANTNEDRSASSDSDIFLIKVLFKTFTSKMF